MKFFLLAFVAFIAVVNGAYLPVDNNQETVLAQNELVRLIRNFLNIFKKILAYYKPFPFSDIPAQHITGKDIDLNIDLKEVKVSEADNYTIDYIETNKSGLGVDFHFTIPKVHLEGQYKVSGVVRQATVNGDGNFTVDIDKLVLTGTIRVSNEKPYPKIKGIDMKYDLEGVKTELEGLSIQGMLEEEKTELVNTKFFEFLQTKEDVSDVMTRHLVQEALNKMIDAYSKWFPTH